MSNLNVGKRRSPVRFLFENSLFLVGGAVVALLWANFFSASYDDFHHLHWGEEKWQSLHFLVNDIFMAFFFAIAAKEVWESMLPGGALSSARKAAAPLMATAGGMVGPAGLYLLGVVLFSNTSEPIENGWAVPTATDIAFSYMVARFIFGPGHPGIAFLLLLAIADDAGGLIILAIFYPEEPVSPLWLLLTVGAVLIGFGMRKLKLQSFWWYLLIPGVLCWFSVFKAGLHPALGLVPMIPTLPHAHTDLGVFAREELKRRDTLNEFEHWWKNPVEIFLGLFGLMNAGVQFSSVGVVTYLVLVGLLVGKPLGITLFTWLGEKLFKLQIPAGMNYREIATIGMIAGIGFTVALFVSTAAFKVGGDHPFTQETLDAAKMGALASFSAAILAFVFKVVLGVRRLQPADAAAGAEENDAGSDAGPGGGVTVPEASSQEEVGAAD